MKISSLFGLLTAIALIAACIPIPNRTPESIQCLVLTDADIYPVPATGLPNGVRIHPVAHVREGQLLTVIGAVEDNPTGQPVIISTLVGWVILESGDYIRSEVCR